MSVDVEGFVSKELNLEGLIVPTSSGRTALKVALLALQQVMPHRKEVVLPSYSCRGLLDPIIACGLTPVFVDVESDLNISQRTMEAHVGPQTLAVIAVHLGGKRIADIEVISKLAKENGAVLIEDLCQALGGRDGDRVWGGSAPMAIYSFGLGKNLMATAGGMLVARDFLDVVQHQKAKLDEEETALAQARLVYIMRVYHSKGLEKILAHPPFPIDAFGSAYGHHRLSLLDARLLEIQLKKMKEIVRRRQWNAAFFLENFRGLEGISVPGQQGRHIWTKFTVSVASAETAWKIRSYLEAAGIETETMYTPLHLRDCGKPYAKERLKVTEEIYARVFNLPVRPSLLPEQTEYLARMVREAILRS